MGVSSDELKSLAIVVKCVQEFEELTSNFYDMLSSKLDDRSKSLPLKWISVESDSHAVLMRSIYELLGIETSGVDCSKLVGTPWHVLEELMKSIESGGFDISDILSKLEFVEGFFGEETYNKLLIAMLRRLMVKEFGDVLDEILSEVVDEEKYHESIIKLLKRGGGSTTN